MGSARTPSSGTRCRSKVAILRVRDARLGVHDFRRIGRQLVFDVTMPAQLRGGEAELLRTLETALAEMGEPGWTLDVTFDPEG